MIVDSGVCQALRLQVLLPGHDIALETGGDAVVAVGSQVERLEAREVQRDLLGQGYDTDVCSLSRGQNFCRFLIINQAYRPKTAQAAPGQGCGAKRSTRKA